MPRGVTPPTFNRYDPGMTYGRHVDNPLMGAGRLRTDLSVTVFLSDLDSYDGGELCIESDLDVRRVRLPAGDAVIYPSGLVHWVEPVTRGVRIAAIAWIQSVIRDHAMRQVVADSAGYARPGRGGPPVRARPHLAACLREPGAARRGDLTRVASRPHALAAL
jgi:PKHD-type hydroxylase